VDQFKCLTVTVLSSLATQNLWCLPTWLNRCPDHTAGFACSNQQTLRGLTRQQYRASVARNEGRTACRTMIAKAR